MKTSSPLRLKATAVRKGTKTNTRARKTVETNDGETGDEGVGPLGPEINTEPLFPLRQIWPDVVERIKNLLIEDGEATEPNGCVFDNRGQLVGRLLFGDGVADLQTTTSDEIWVSYSDEGTYGNLGWRKPIGKAGILRFNLEGNICFRYEGAAGLSPIDDCYSLNVVSEREAWCCYYSQFSIVKIYDDQIAHHWASPVKGSSGLAVWGNNLAMQDAYKGDGWRFLEVTEADAVVEEEAITFRTPGGLPLAAKSARARGSAIWFVVGEDIYRFDLTNYLNRRSTRITGGLPS